MRVAFLLSLILSIFATFALSFRHGVGMRGNRNNIPRLRTHARGQRWNPYKRQAGVNIWIRDVTADVKVMEKAFVKRTMQTIFLKSIDRKLAQADIHQSLSVYDYKNNFVAVKTRLNMKVCLILPGFIAGDYGTTSAEVMGRNTVPNTDLIGEFTMASDGPLTHTQVQLLNSTNPELMGFCHRGINPVQVVDATTVVNDLTDLSETRPLSVSTIKGKVTIYLKKIH